MRKEGGVSNEGIVVIRTEGGVSIGGMVVVRKEGRVSIGGGGGGSKKRG